MKREDFAAIRVVIELALSIALSLLGGVYMGRFLGERCGQPGLYLAAGILWVLSAAGGGPTPSLKNKRFTLYIKR